MRIALKLATVASVFALTAASAGWAQTYIPNPGPQGSYSNSQGSYNPNYNQGAFNQGSNSSANQGNWRSNSVQGSSNTGMQGTSTPYGGQNLSQSGYGGASNNINTYQEAENELSKYGYSNLQGLRAVQGWSADAMKNGQRVHVILSDNGLVATFPGQ